MKYCQRLLLFTFFFFAVHTCMGQAAIIDSLQHKIATAETGKEKLSFIFSLCEQTMNADSVLPYVIMAEALASQTKNKTEIDKASYCRAGFFTRKNITDSALTIMKTLVDKYKNNEEQQDLYLKFLFFQAKILDRSNQYTNALGRLFEVIETAETLKDTLIQIQAKTGIGWVQMEMEQYTEALQWLYKAMNTSTNSKFYKNYGALYSNMAAAYNSLGKTDSAQHYIGIAIKDARENENLIFLATALSMEAKIFVDNKQYKLAEAPLKEAVEIRKKLNDPFYTVYDMSSLASYYATNNQTAKGIALCKEGIHLAQKSGLSSQLLMIYHSLAENYKVAGNTVEYSKTLEAIISLKDSFNNLNSSKLLADMQAGSNVLKKEKTITEQKLNLKLKNYWLFGSALFALMTGIIIWLSFKNYDRRQNIKLQIALAEEKRIAAQSIIDAEENERKRIAADLHDNIGAYASAIKADVEKITDSGFQKNNNTLQNLQQHSQEIINSLRDTIWVLNKEHITITGISDRIKNYINQLQPSYDHIQFYIHEEIKNDTRISSQNALNIFRIVQEAIHNALKHSDASAVNIHIRSSEAISINVNDDGKGMETNHSSDGNGLLNMKARAREIGMKLTITSARNEGTALLLETNTTN